MRFSAKILPLIFSLFLVQFAFAQNDGFVQYRYPNGAVSSEGQMLNGKPDGFWKSYYEDGTLKSEGKRTMFELDSIWNFYAPDGNLEKSITYRDGKKNGFSYNYKFYYNDDSAKVYYLDSKELFLNGSHEGNSFFYSKDGHLQYVYKYVGDKRDGDGYEFDNDSTVISIITYRRGYLVQTQKVNRTDENGQKQGRWVEFYQNGAKKTETQYYNGKVNGVQRNFDQSGKLVDEQRFVDGKPFTVENDTTLADVEIAEYKKTFYDNGKLKTEGAFMHNMPIGIHKEYDENGNLKKTLEYSSESVLVGEGMYDENGKRTGKWRLYDGYWDYFYAEGEFRKGKKTGHWSYFYASGNPEMEGEYEVDKPVGEWTWLYPNGAKRRMENYYDGLLDGAYEEYDSIGNLLVKGNYSEGMKTGEWESHIGDVIEYGSYSSDEKSGEWKSYYVDSNKLCFSGSFRDGDAVGLHKWLYPNGQIETVGEYRGGLKHKVWYKYYPDGTVYMTRTYRFGNLIKIDNVKVQKPGRKK